MNKSNEATPYKGVEKLVKSSLRKTGKHIERISAGEPIEVEPEPGPTENAFAKAFAKVIQEPGE